MCVSVCMYDLTYNWFPSTHLGAIEVQARKRNEVENSYNLSSIEVE